MRTSFSAFNGLQSNKDKYLARVEAHRAADQLVKGQYWEGGKGCAVGCTIHGDSHEDYEADDLQIPRIIARLEDRIFEGLPNDRAQVWPGGLLSAADAAYAAYAATATAYAPYADARQEHYVRQADKLLEIIGDTE